MKGYMPPSHVKNREDVKKIQREIGAEVDGIWGEETWRLYEDYMEESIDTPLVRRALEYVRDYRADYYLVQAVKKVEKARLEGKLPDDTNIMIELAAQFDGVPHELFDHIDNAEYRIPYKDGIKFKWADCSSWVQSLILLLFDVNPGTWTEGQWKWGKDKRVDENELRPTDLVFWNFKPKRNVSHVALYVGQGYIQHTTSPRNPLRIGLLKKYNYKKIVGCIRPLTDEQYASLIIKNNEAPVTQPEFRELKLTDPYMRGDDIKAMQVQLNLKGHPCGKADSVYGPDTEQSVISYKSTLVDGVVTKDVWDELFS